MPHREGTYLIQECVCMIDYRVLFMLPRGGRLGTIGGTHLEQGSVCMVDCPQISANM